MDLVLWLAIGALIGWLGSVVLDADPEQGVFMNVVAGIVGALLGGWLVGPLVGAAAATRGGFSPAGLLVALIGAVLLLAVYNLVRRRRMR